MHYYIEILDSEVLLLQHNETRLVYCTLQIFSAFMKKCLSLCWNYLLSLFLVCTFKISVFYVIYWKVIQAVVIILFRENEENTFIEHYPNEFKFEIHVETNRQNGWRLIQKALQAYKDEMKGPTLVLIQSQKGN